MKQLSAGHDIRKVHWCPLMPVRFSLTVVLACLAAGFLLAAAGAQDQPAPQESSPPPDAGRRSVLFRTPPGLVYFAGTVERVSGKAAIVDLGDVHALKEGARVTVFRARDGQFSPLGVIRAANTFPAWMQSEPITNFEPAAGDLVLYIRTVGEIGHGFFHQDRFLARQQIADRDRNGYSTLRQQAAAEALLDIRLQQPSWFQYEKRIAGVVLGRSMGDGLPERGKRLLDQIDFFRRLHEDGFPVSTAAGQQWEEVMRQLQGPPPEPEITLTSRPAEPAVAVDAAADAVSVPELRLVVDRVFFDRTVEERAIAAAMCLAMLAGVSGNEPEWLRLELAHTQFPRLTDDIQFRSDAISLVRQLREQQQRR